MRDGEPHDITAVPMEDGVPTTDVAPETLRSGLGSDDDRVRTAAATAAAGLAADDPGTVASVLPALVEGLADDQQVVVYQSALALSQLAADDPERVVPAVDRLAALTVHDLSLVRLVAARTLGFVALERPDRLAGHAGALVEALTTDPATTGDPASATDPATEPGVDPGADPARPGRGRSADDHERTRRTYTREVAVNVLIEAGERDPAVLRPHVDAVTGLLADDDAHVARGAAELLGLVARDDPEAVAVDPLVDALAHPDTAVAATAVTTLGHLGDPAAVDPLYDLAADPDRDETLTDFAAEVAAALDR